MKRVSCPRARSLSGIILSLALLAVSLMACSMISCAPDQEFGELVICSDVDSQTFEPEGRSDEFSIDSPRIAAVIKVSGVRGYDQWRVTWENKDTGEVIADSASNYPGGRTGYLEGYLPVVLLPDDDTFIIARPGDYIVSFFHNGDLIDTAGFTVIEPDASILEAGFYSDIGQDGQPLERTSVFQQDDDIYAALKLDYRTAGDRYVIRWYLDGILHAEDEYLVKQDHYVPGYIIVQLVNEDDQPFPVGEYHMEVISRGEVEGKYSFDIIADEYSEEIFSENDLFEDQESGFRLPYPDRWSFEKEEVEVGLKISLYPENRLKDVMKIKIWALQPDYSPEPSEYGGYADRLLAEQIEQDEDSSIARSEDTLSLDGLEITEITYVYADDMGKGWSVTFSFLRSGTILFLYMRYTDLAYADYARKVMEYIMINTELIDGQE
jgi:hypothetical protein